MPKKLVFGNSFLTSSIELLKETCSEFYIKKAINILNTDRFIRIDNNNYPPLRPSMSLSSPLRAALPPLTLSN